MALRRQNLSPSANLLRTSRLFSLPNPLPRPPVAEAVGASTLKASDTATLPFPTHQAIATTKASLARGDWGLKRPLPKRSRIVQRSNPVVRVTQLDTIEQVTDYDSATDHVRTRQKFDELGIPLMKGMGAMRDLASASPPEGAFEALSDVTSYEGENGLDEAGLILETIKNSVRANTEARRMAKKTKKTDSGGSPPPFIPFSLPRVDPAIHNLRRWKHDGPWLPGMSADDFTTYIRKQIAPRRAEFMRYVEQYVKNEIYTQNSARSSKTLPLEPEEAQAAQAEQEKQWSNISDAEIRAGIENLRRKAALDPLGSDLVQRLIIPFLRLPTIRLKNTTYAADANRHEVEQFRFDDSSAPLSTHPSAGLGYLRTNAVLTNHPILGPQAERPPVKARVLQPRVTATQVHQTARLGLAGFVVNDSERNTGGGNNDFNRYQRMRSAAHNVEVIDVDTPGGMKLDVLPRFASVSNDGRIHIKTVRSTGAEVNVARGELEDRAPVRVRPQSVEERPKPQGRDGGVLIGEGSEQARRAEEMIRALSEGDGGEIDLK